MSAGPFAGGGMDFLEHSRTKLAGLLDAIGGLTDKGEIRRHTDRYTHLLKLQLLAATAAPADADAARRRFDDEYAVVALPRAVDDGANGANGGAAPSAEQMEEFRRTVSAWYVTDNEEKALRRQMAGLRLQVSDRAALKAGLTEKIMAFMERHDIEDLSTRDGVLRFNRVEVRRAVNKNVMVDRIKEYFGGDESAAEALIGNVTEPVSVERCSLRRLKPRG